MVFQFGLEGLEGQGLKVWILELVANLGRLGKGDPYLTFLRPEHWIRRKKVPKKTLISQEERFNGP